MISINCKEKSYTEFVTEDYFPVIVSVNDYVDNISYCEYGCDSKSLLEFTVNRTNKAFYRMKLILCKKYEKRAEMMTLPDSYIEGTITMDVPDKNSTDTLFTIIYSDGVEIRLSDKKAVQYYKNGNLYIGIDSNEDLCIVKVSNLSESEIEHVLNELNYQEKD